ncbi:deoxyribonuclease [Gordonia iterans]|uniref:Deoxyribonuclease n=1 Tax=Gordonia iterans TaxID=1004901 RepID=A0A2S0KDN0_9ACTN|nr:deoxyribonuclease [Gordonia iterans]
MTAAARRVSALLVAVAVASSLTACEPGNQAADGPTTTTVTTWVDPPESAADASSPTTEPDRDPADDARASRALGTLGTLPVKGRAPKTGYSRDLFGQRWSDDVDVELGHNGCDTRNDILRRDLTETITRAGTRDCVVTSGTLADPYTGKTIAFVRGERTSNDVQIDHVVALSDAWQKGAQQLTSAQRRDFANDPRNLQAVDGPANQQKGDGDAATWLPPNRGYRCTYVARQIEVKAAYRLWVTAAEKAAMERVLTACGGAVPATSAPTGETTSRSARPPQPERTQPERTTQPRQFVEPPAGEVYYKNCAAVRAAGKAPLYRGQPGYSSTLDRDGDGVACE